MQINRKLLGVSAELSQHGTVDDVDIVGLIRRLLLFDQYVLASVRLQEFPHLARHLGFAGLRDLLTAKIIQIRCECFQMTQTGQSGMFGDPILPQLSYKFHWVDSHNQTKYVHDCLQAMHGVTKLHHKEVKSLKKLIAESIVPVTKESKLEFAPNFSQDVVHPRLLEVATKMSVARSYGSDVPKFAVRIHDEGDSTYRVETDLGKRLNISVEKAHKIIEAALLAISSLSQILLEMKAYSALNGFRDEALPLFRAKLDFLAENASSYTREDAFNRVIEIADISTPGAKPNRVSIQNLLEVRDSSEIREFRDWLSNCSNVSDKEIKDVVGGFRAKAGLAVSGKAGKALRFLVTNGLGLLPHPPAALASLGLSALDSFVVDNVLPRSGIAAFVNESYPSIFDGRER